MSLSGTGARLCSQAVTANAAQQMVFAGLRSVGAKGQINGLTTDAAGDVYLAFDQGDGVRVLKVANDGEALLAQVHLGATGDSAVALAADLNGNIYIAGTSTSGSLAATSGAAFGTATAGTTNSFVAKFDGNLNPVFLTFTGGTRIAASAVAASADSVFVTGITYASDLPVSATAIGQSPALGSVQNGFAEAFSADGTTLKYATYITGALGDTTPAGIAVDAGDDVWLVGSTTASGFPTISAIVPDIFSTPSGFLLQLTPAGDGFVYSTFVPGSGLSSIALDSTGLALLLSGQVALGQFPVDTVQAPLVPTSYQVLLQMSLDGSAVASGTVIAPGLQSVVAASSGGGAWVGGSFAPGAAPFLPQNAFSTVGNAYAVRVTPSVGVDQTVRFGGLADFNQTYASVPVGLTGVAVDGTGSLFAGGFAQPTASASLLSSERYDFPLRQEPAAALPSVIADAELTGTSCGGSLCSGSGGYLVKVDPAQSAPALAFSADGVPSATVRNFGSTAAEGLQFTTSAGSLTTDCGTELAPGGECDVLLAGGGAGTLTASTSNGGGGAVAFRAFSNSPGSSGLTFQPKELDFAIQTAGSETQLKTITVANLSGSAATFSEGVAGAPQSATPFSEVASDCRLSGTSGERVLGAGASCTITVGFSAFPQPASDGFVQREWAIGTGEVALTGYSQSADLSVSASEVDFGTEFQGGLVLPRYLYLSNASDAAQPHAAVGLPDNSPFTIADGCPSSLAPNSVCRLRIDYLSSFSPSADSVTLALDNGLSVLLTGQTMPPQTVGGSTVSSGLTVSPTQATFGNAVVVTGRSSATQTLAITNSGTTSIPLSVAISGDFSDVTSCGSTLPAMSSCAIVIAFTPSQPGLRQGLLTVDSGAGTTPLTAALSGTGIGMLAANNGTLSLGSIPIGQPQVKFYKVTQPFNSLRLQATGPYLVTIVEDAGFGFGNPPSSDYEGGGSGSCNNCWIGVRFQPTSPGEQDGTLTFDSDPKGSPYVLQLTGSGTATSGLVVSPNVIAFGTTPVYSASGATLVNLTNLVSTGTAVLVSGIATSGDFSVVAGGPGSGGCAGSLAYAATCSVWVQFAPTAPGIGLGTLNLETSAGVASASLTGTGTTGPGVAISPLALTFAVAPGEVNQAQNVSVTNNGKETLTVDKPTTSTSNFTAVSSCSSLVPGASCSLQVSFTPGATPIADVLSLPVVSRSSGGAQQSQTMFIGLTGNFTQTDRGLAVSPATVAFGPVATGSVSSPRLVTVTNVTAKQVSVSLSMPRNYEVLNNLCSTLAPGANCTFSVSFVPLENGDLPGTISIAAASSDGSESNTALLSADGFGVGSGALTISGGLIVNGVFDFGSVAAGQSASQAFQLTNASTEPVAVRRIVSLPPFLSTTTCGELLQPAESCSATVLYSPQGGASGPSIAANDLGSLTIESDAQSSPDILNLKGQPTAGTGTPSASPLSAFSLSQGSLSFGSTMVGDASAPQTLVLTNTGTSSVLVSSVTATADFTVRSGCGLVTSGASCPIALTGSPQAAGIRIAALEISSDASDSLEYVSLIGAGISSPLVFSPASLDFGTVLVGTTATLPLQLTNTGNTAIAFTVIATSANFAATGNCPTGGASLPPQGTCVEQVTFQPSATGGENGAVNFTTSAATGTLRVSLSGTGVQPQLTAAPAQLNFGSIALNASANSTLQLSNRGAVPITGLRLSASGDYAVTGPCPQSTLASGASCTAQVTFTPTAIGVRDGTVTLTSSDPTSPLSVPLTGTGVPNAGFVLTVDGGTTASATVTSGNFATFALLVTPSGSFGGDVVLTCTPVHPALYASCSLLPPQVTLSGSAQKSTATINTEVSGSGVGTLKELRRIGSGRIFLALLLPGLLSTFRRGRATRRGLCQGAAFGGILFALLLFGCGGHGSGVSSSSQSQNDTPAGQYQFLVRATSTNGVAPPQTVTLNTVVTSP